MEYDQNNILNKELKMNFPSMAIDDFYQDPTKVREIALSQEYRSAPNGEYPGKRTKSIDLIDKQLFDEFANRFFSIYYDFNHHRVDWQIDTYFQIIDAHQDAVLNQGWVHVDYNSVVSGVIYLNPNPSSNSGTVICDIKEGEQFDYEQKLKHEFNLGLLQDVERYKKDINHNNNKFNDSIMFRNKYNRLISFDGQMFHKINSFESCTEPRLTQVFFVNKLLVNNTPLIRMRNE
jgi:hypothetical protein